MKKWDDFINEMEPERRKEAQIIQAKARMVSELIHIRETLGWTQQQLADAAGMKQPAIARFEGGTTAPSIETIIRIALALNVQIRFVGSTAGLEEAASFEEEVFV
ncbi:helix-turn-helix protein [Paenibacillus taihuensis]|uniref:Helix-turn-helix protein n=1 Tax=Paenibacillus taihuensis TaxID=1156355 RepID=A0A3D9RVQ0_9BACL|nr:helix-turn-helix transcriptional regulator [Paenibacillus taihuensis]REE83927.1 helix-turn-helix protein [Paenibacillus taihuensis]